MGLQQNQKLLHSKGNSQETNRQHTEWEKIFANDSTDKRLISRTYNELLKLNTHVTDNHIKKWEEDMDRHFYQDIQMAIRHMKKCSSSLALREIQIKTTLRYHLTQVRKAKINKTGNNMFGGDVEKGEPSSTVGGNASWCSHFGINLF